MDIAQITQALQAAGVGRHATALAALAEPSLHARVADSRSAAGAHSRLGGMPSVPAGFEWPRWTDAPLSFIGQLRLADLAPFAAAKPLPSTGVLSFFYAAEQGTWGFDPADRGSARVFWFPDESALTSVSAPRELAEEARFTPVSLVFEERLTLPVFDSLAVEALALSSEEADAYAEFVEESGFMPLDGMQHQVLGHPRPIQSEMQTECQLVTNGLFCGDPTGYNDPRAAALREGARDWRLLFQVDSEESAGMMWGDAGMLYYWIRDEDLRARRFDEAWMILQCG
jgi:uncharacterized protein YwqG